VSSARVGAVAVRTGAGLGADVGLVVLTPQNEEQPRSYRIEPAAPYLADTANTMTEQALGDPRGTAVRLRGDHWWPPEARVALISDFLTQQEVVMALFFALALDFRARTL